MGQERLVFQLSSPRQPPSILQRTQTLVNNILFYTWFMENVSFSHGALQTWWKSAKAVRQRQLGTTRSLTEIEGRLKRIVSEPLIPSLIYFLFTKFKIQRSFVKRVFSRTE